MKTCPSDCTDARKAANACGLEYDLIYSRRKSISIQILEDGKLVVRAPSGTPRKTVEDILEEKAGWIAKKQRERREASAEKRSGLLTEEEQRHMKELAKGIFAAKAQYYARIMGVDYNRITIREQKTRWGSCSSKGNLNFNWKLLLAPEQVVDYVVVHELAHRKEMNHSSGFYAVVESVMPDYRIWQNWLRENGRGL